MKPPSAKDVVFASDLRAVCEQAGAVFDRSGFSVCPLHGSGRNTHQFHIFTGKDGRQIWKCFGDCGEGGDVIDFVMLWQGLDFSGAVRYLTGAAASSDELAILAAERAAQAAERAAQAAEHAAKEARRALDELRRTQIWIKYHEEMTEEARRLWREAGVPDWYQDWLKLGYTPDYRYWHAGQVHSTPALTIPHYGENWEVQQVAMRLLNPVDARDKYRPLRSGIPIPPFIADPDKGWDAENILVCEGQKKAAVAFVTLNSNDWQAIGVTAGAAGNPQKNGLPPSGEQLAAKLRGRNVVVIFDPDAHAQSVKLAQALQARYLLLPQKLDDFILKFVRASTDFRRLLAQARRSV